MIFLRVKKFITGMGHAGLMIALLLAIFGNSPFRGLGPPDWQSDLEMAFVTISFLSLGLTVFRLRDYLHSLEDRMTLRLLVVPSAVNLVLSGYAFVFSDEPIILCLSVLSYAGWLMVTVSVIHTCQKRYIRFFRGYLPKNVWINPPPSILQEGDTILVHGPMADFVREAMGHTETVVKGRDGRLYTISALIEAGTTWRLASELLEDYLRDGYDYIILRLKTPLTVDQSRASVEIAEEMLAANKVWRTAAQKRVKKIFSALPLPQAWKEKLLKRWMPTGYDVIGKYWGGLRKDRWTCIAVNIYLLRRLGVKMAEYGTGMFGLFGEFNPILPIRIIRDPAYRWLSTADRDAHAKEQ
jgi:hypothetical protein